MLAFIPTSDSDTWLLKVVHLYQGSEILKICFKVLKVKVEEMEENHEF